MVSVSHWLVFRGQITSDASSFAFPPFFGNGIDVQFVAWFSLDLQPKSSRQSAHSIFLGIVRAYGLGWVIALWFVVAHETFSKVVGI